MLENLGATQLQRLDSVRRLLKTIPSEDALRQGSHEALAWLGQAAAEIKAWDSTRSLIFGLNQHRLASSSGAIAKQGYDGIVTLLHEAEHTLSSTTTKNEMAAVLSQGEVRETTEESESKKIFIGHGGSTEWLKLSNFLSQKLGLQCDEFNIVPTAGLQNAERIEAMLKNAHMAFLVMTAEDQHQNGTMHARGNVIHEIGLFQAKLGSRRAIVMLEAGCSIFSNLQGLTTIKFPQDNIMAGSEEVRGVLTREHML